MPRNPSERQQDASRRNGARSRGPITAAGKAQSSMNNFRHGRYAQLSCLLPIEDREAFARYLRSLSLTFRPANDGEANLVESIAIIDWRLTRIATMETRALVIEMDHHMAGLRPHLPLPSPADHLTAAATSLVDRSRFLPYLSVAESRLVAQRATLVRQLIQLQNRRPATDRPFRTLPPRPFAPSTQNAAQIFDSRSVNAEEWVRSKPEPKAALPPPEHPLDQSLTIDPRPSAQPEPPQESA